MERHLPMYLKIIGKRLIPKRKNRSLRKRKLSEDIFWGIGFNQFV